MGMMGISEGTMVVSRLRAAHSALASVRRRKQINVRNQMMLYSGYCWDTGGCLI